MKLPIYLDHHATTPLDPLVLEAMMPYLTAEFGNAASREHSFGKAALERVEKSRADVAAFVRCAPEEIIFTSGATEADNLAIRGVAAAYRERGNHLITQVTEHRAVLDTCRALEEEGMRVTYAGVDRDGRVRPDEIERAITPETILISVMTANNEIGTLQPVREIGRIAKKHGVLFHTDASQAAGKIPLDVERDGADLMSFTAHKFHGPKGIGALYVRGKNPYVKINPMMTGGGHERGLRSGTLNVPAIAGFARACEISGSCLTEEAARMRRLRDRLWDSIRNGTAGAHLNGHPGERLPNNLNISFDGVDGGLLLSGLTAEIAVSSGAACTSAQEAPSFVLKAIGLPARLVYAALRFGIGRFNTEEEIDYAARRVIETVGRLRASQPFSETVPGSRSRGF